MQRRVLIIDGHPDASAVRFCHALAEAYGEGAAEAGHEVRRISVGEQDVPILRSASHFAMPADQDFIARAQEDLKWADHVTMIFPIWLGGAPALLKAFLEQIARGGLIAEADRRSWQPKLVGKTARIVATMGMPAPIYHWVFGAHGVMSLKTSVLNFAGIAPVRLTLFGSMGSASSQLQQRRLARIRQFGRAAR